MNFDLLTAFLTWTCIAGPLSFSLPAHGEREAYTDFNLRSRTVSNDIHLHAPVAERGSLSGLYAFGDATLTIKNRRDESEKVITGKDGYYDPSSDTIVLRQIDHNSGEALLYISRGKLTFY